MREIDKAVEGVRHFNAGRQEQAKQIALTLLRKNPNQPIALMLMGNYAHLKGQLDDAINYYKRSLKIRPNLEPTIIALAKAYRKIGNPTDALTNYLKAIQIDPNNQNTLLETGEYLYELGNLEKAEEAITAALKINPNISQAYVLLSRISRDRNESSEIPIALCRKAIQIDPKNIEASNSLAVYLLGNGEPQEASQIYANLVATTGPDAAHICSNWLLSLHYLDTIKPEELFEHHRLWLSKYKSETRRTRCGFANKPDPNKKLKIGFTSPDFHGHSVFYFLNSLFSSYEKNEYEFICFSDRHPLKEDRFTSILKGYVDQWHHTTGLNRANYKQIILKSGIDILVDLSGHTAENRLLTYMERNAPVQITWLGYPDTSGLDSMDYRIVDDITDPSPWADRLATEELFRIPAPFLCFRPEKEWHGIKCEKETTSDKIVFGSFNMASKISASTIRVWCEILKQHPGSELVIKCRYGKEKPFTQITNRLRVLGIPENRLRILDYQNSKEEHLKTYNQVDIALDPLPYNGTTTSVEAMWMGVPVITKAGDRHCARVGMTLLKSVGLDEFIANSDDEYVQKAVDLAKNLEKLRKIKSTLRQRMLDSPLCDAEGFARKFEAALRTMWIKWCEEKKAVSS